MKAAGALALCGILASQAGMAEGPPLIGRLFSAPRNGGAVDPAPPSPGGHRRIDGTVERSSNRNTVWIDGVAIARDGSTGRIAVAAGSKEAPDKGTAAGRRIP